MNYQVAVCDDQEEVRVAVRQIIEAWNPEMEVSCFSSGEALLEEYRPYQAIFLDIDMGGINGIETGVQIREKDKNVKIIYLTAYRDYVAGAFRVHAFQYLLKPVREKEVTQVLEEVFSYTTGERKDVLDFQTGQGLMCLATDEIYYFEYRERKVNIVTEVASYTMQERIGNIRKRMEPYGFSMPHQSFVVNMLHVKNVSGGQICLDNGMEIPVAQKKQKEWKRELLAYLAERVEGRLR